MAGQTSTSRQPTRSSSTHPSHSHNVPLSARRSAPLDLSTVERRGQPSNPREPSKRVRPHGIPEAPTFRPTEEEFKDPVAYIQKIAPEGKRYGICRVIPPDNWQPSFAIDTEVYSPHLVPMFSVYWIRQIGNPDSMRHCQCVPARTVPITISISPPQNKRFVLIRMISF